MNIFQKIKNAIRKEPVPAKPVRVRDARTDRFTTKADAKARPYETVTEAIK